MCYKNGNFELAMFDHLAFPGSSRFAYTHEFTQIRRKESQTTKGTDKTSRSMKILL